MWNGDGMPRLMVLNKYEDALITTYDFEGEMDTERFERYVREELHHRGRIKERHEPGKYIEDKWWVCDSVGKPVFIAFVAKPKT